MEQEKEVTWFPSGDWKEKAAASGVSGSFWQSVENRDLLPSISII